MSERSLILNRARSQPYDLCIIGGGATGAGCALDAQLRGLRTVLVEAVDFASQTSSASTKMAHGGVRYLQAAAAHLDRHQYRLVTHALRERALMLRNAPHLAHSLEFLVPCFALTDRLYYAAGLKLYDWVAGRDRLAPSRILSRDETLRRLPGVQQSGLSGAVSYADGQFDDARYALALIQTFRANGGEALNYARATGFEKDARGRIVAVQVQDRSGPALEIRARAFVNATGPVSDTVRKLASPDAPPRMRPSKGIHILFPLPADWKDAMLVPKTEDGRVVFAIPYHGRLLVGTTDEEASPNDEMVVTRREVDYLLRQMNPYLKTPLSANDIVSAFAGLRPLVQDASHANTSALVRDDELVQDEKTGLISILGGKWTTYRLMAEKTIDRVQQFLKMKPAGCRTQAFPLTGSEDYHPDLWRSLSRDFSLPIETAQHLAGKFGTVALNVLRLVAGDPDLAAPLLEGAPPIRAEVIYTVRHELAQTLEDVLSRRLGLEMHSWQMASAAAPATAELMARELHWSHEKTTQAVISYQDRIAKRVSVLSA